MSNFFIADDSLHSQDMTVNLLEGGIAARRGTTSMCLQ